MGDFSKNYRGMKYSLADEENGKSGLRNAQIDVIHTLGAYYTTNRESAMISMPTGTGKTTVIMMAPYLLLRIKKF